MHSDGAGGEMTKHVMEASHAISEAVKAIKPAVVAAYPITPQTHIVERISDFVANGEIDSRYIRVESEFSAISACLGASATGVRTYTSTSSQGLALMFEVLFIVSGMRLPVLMSVVNRAMSAPISIWNDHQDSIAVRDVGWMQFYAETAQESFDLTIMQAMISEDARVLTPSMVCMDGFTLSHVYEPIDLPEQKAVDEFLPEYKPVHAILDPEEPLTLGPIGFPSHYMELRYTQQEAMNNSLPVIEEVFKKYNRKFPCEIEHSRPEEYAHIQEYRLEDAEIVLVAMGSVCGTIKDVIDEQRSRGVKVGLMKLITYRPFPREIVRKTLEKAQKVAVIEKALSVGATGVVYDEIASSMYESEDRPELRSFIVGLGGRDVTLDHVRKIIKMTAEGKGIKEEWMF
jgi:pyruvate ferredoxin oxidoreductase alpha subunit